MANANIKAVITADDRASGVLKRFGGHVDSVGRGILTGAKIAGAAFVATGAAAVAMGVSSVKSFSDSENAMAQMIAVLKSTKHAAGLAEDQLSEQAEALQKLTKFSDEAVMSAQSLLLTFTNVKGKVFEDSIPLILDMSQAMGQDLKSSTIQLGKALNDPIKGMTALTRVGVAFTEKQKKQIETLVKAGKSAEAQRIILAELRTEFGGSAEAAGKTFAGSLERLKNQLDDVKESVGRVIINALTPFIGKAAEFISSIDWEKVIKRSTDAIKNMATFVREEIIPQLKQWISNIVEVAKQIAEYLEPKIVALWHTLQERLFPALYRLWKEVLEPLIPVIGTALVAALGFAIDATNLLWTAWSAVINFMLDHEYVFWLIVGVLGAIKTALFLNGALAAFSKVIAGATMKYTALKTLIATPMVMPAIVVAAAIASLVEVKKAVDAVKGAFDAMNAAAMAQADLENSNAAVRRRLEDLAQSGTSAQRKRAKAALAAGIGYASGGFTGQGNSNEFAGIVHKGEYVVPKNQVDQNTGLPRMGGGTTINLNVNVGMYAGTPMERRKLAETLWSDLQDIANQRNMKLGTA